MKVLPERIHLFDAKRGELSTKPPVPVYVNIMEPEDLTRKISSFLKLTFILQDVIHPPPETITPSDTVTFIFQVKIPTHPFPYITIWVPRVIVGSIDTSTFLHRYIRHIVSSSFLSDYEIDETNLEGTPTEGEGTTVEILPFTISTSFTNLYVRLYFDPSWVLFIPTVTNAIKEYIYGLVQLLREKLSNRYFYTDADAININIRYGINPPSTNTRRMDVTVHVSNLISKGIDFYLTPDFLTMYMLVMEGELTTELLETVPRHAFSNLSQYVEVLVTHDAELKCEQLERLLKELTEKGGGLVGSTQPDGEGS